MGGCYSRIEREEMVSRSKARKRYMKQFVKARQSFSVSHSMYIKSLRSTGSALVQFAAGETNLHHLPPLLPPPPPHPPPPPSPPLPPPPPMSPSSYTWTTSTTSAAAALPPPPPPPPPSTWDFWDPFLPSCSMSVAEEEWEAATIASEVAITTTTTTATVGAASVTAPLSAVSGFSTESELAMVVSSTKAKGLVEIIKELDEYFLNAADTGGTLSLLLEVPTYNFYDRRLAGKVFGYGKSLNPLLWTRGSGRKISWFGKLREGMKGGNVGGGGVINGSHSSTVERLYAWEKKLYLEVKNAETLKKEHKKRAAQLRHLELKRTDYLKTEKTKKEVEKLESRMMVASQAIETTSAEIIKLRETELYPQLVELVKGLMCMWRSMYECHQVQTHIVQQLKYLDTTSSIDPTSEIHWRSTLQLQLEVQQWHLSFCNLVKAQQDYIQSLTGWLLLSLIQFSNKPISKTRKDSAIYSLCEEWHLAIDHAPDKVASEGIKTFSTVIDGIVVQQAEEQKQKKRLESVFKELEKKVAELRSLEHKHGPYSSNSTRRKDRLGEKQAKVDILRAKAEDEGAKHEKLASVTRAMTLNHLQTGLPHVFQAVTGFASVWTRAFESVYNQAKSPDEMHNVKSILP